MLIVLSVLDWYFDGRNQSSRSSPPRALVVILFPIADGTIVKTMALAHTEIVHEGWLVKSPPTKRIWRAVSDHVVVEFPL